MTEDEDLQDIEQSDNNQPQKRKRIMILLLPLLIVIGVSVGIYFALNNSYDSLSVEYSIVQHDKDSPDNITVFYDLPELKTSVKGKKRSHELRIKPNIELSSIEDLKVIEALTPRLSDAIIGHVVELKIDEIEGSTGLYWLKEELLYRLNLVASPIKIKKLNFSVFELQK
ncbi:MAG: hypothetical protein E7017_02500 [Alphaproteobacteria bacterium]|nr:hypothetical protein [Alphaproteobacteria bacterium]